MHDCLRHVGLWIEDPVPPENPEAMAFVRQHSPVSVLTGENLCGFHGFERLIERQGCDGAHIDIPKSGGLLESKRISDFAASYNVWTAAHKPASPVGTTASAHAASAMRNFRIHEPAGGLVPHVGCA
jgi:L-alanine-DL-glutamate epimerase-like enolase superfamily enzyme